MKKFFIEAVSSALQLGKGGNRIISDSEGISFMRPDGEFCNVSAALPTDSSHVVTLEYLSEHFSPDYVISDDIQINVMSGITIGSGAFPLQNRIYLVTHSNDSNFMLGGLYRYLSDDYGSLQYENFEQIELFDGTKMISVNNLGNEDTFLQFNHATMYIWEDTDNLWYASARPCLSGMSVTKTYEINLSPDNLDAPTNFSIPLGSKIKEITIDVLSPLLNTNHEPFLNSGIKVLFGDKEILNGEETDLSEPGFQYNHRLNYVQLYGGDEVMMYSFNTDTGGGYRAHIDSSLISSGSFILYIEYIHP